MRKYCNTCVCFPQHQTDAEKHSAVDRAVMWSSDEVRRSDGGSDSGVRMEPGSKWRRNPSDMSDESDKSPCGRPGPAISQTGSWRRGMTAQVGITSPRTKTTAPPGSTAVKTPGTGTYRGASACFVCPYKATSPLCFPPQCFTHE